jgi:hypothetical protein
MHSSMALLRAMLPEHVIRKLKTQGMSSYITQYHDQVSEWVGVVDVCCCRGQPVSQSHVGCSLSVSSLTDGSPLAL